MEGINIRMKIICISDFDLKGSGYLNIAAPICQELSKNHKVWAMGLGYGGEEHFWDFSLIPTKAFNEVGATVQNIQNEHQFDVCIVALDIPLQEKFLTMFSGRPFKYIGIMPLESNPCIMSTAMMLTQMDKVFCISQFGTDEMNKRGVNAEHLEIGVDTEAWKFRTTDEYKQFRERFGFSEEDFVIFSVADNQERKNISASMEIISALKKRGVPVKFLLVTRPDLQVGWKLQDYASEVGIQSEYVEIPRGISFKELWIYYAMSDVFLSTTKAEGLSLPVLEAMSVGVPVVAPGHTALQEHLSNNKGFSVGWEYTHRDPFLNGFRYWVDKPETEQVLWDIWDKRGKVNLVEVDNARKYVEGKDWNKTIQQIERVLSSYDSDSDSKNQE